jgi:hypothetical protein
MLSASEFAKFISVSLEAGRAKHQRHEVLGLKGAKRGLRFPKWQVTSDGGFLPELPWLFDLLGGDSWTVYRFLTQPKFRSSEFALWAETGVSNKFELPPRG